MARRKCLTKNCHRKPESRGLCQQCRALAFKAIRDGKVTEKKLLELGLMLPKHQPRSPFTKQLAEIGQ